MKGRVMDNNTTTVWLMFLIILSVFLFRGSPDITDALIERLLPKNHVQQSVEQQANTKGQ